MGERKGEGQREGLERGAARRLAGQWIEQRGRAGARVTAIWLAHSSPSHVRRVSYPSITHDTTRPPRAYFSSPRCIRVALHSRSRCSVRARAVGAGRRQSTSTGASARPSGPAQPSAPAA